jgi:hypothetical protein
MKAICAAEIIANSITSKGCLPTSQLHFIVMLLSIWGMSTHNQQSEAVLTSSSSATSLVASC